MKNPIKGIASSPRAMELAIGYMLRVGVLTACAICLVGGVLYIMRYGGTKADFSTFEGAPPMYRSLSGIWMGLKALEPLAIVQTGVVVLLATPVLRVLFSIFAFLFERDYLYVVITCIVFAIILLNMLGGVVG